MSTYIPVGLQARLRKHFADRCGYCQTAERLTVSIFEIEHIIPLAAGGETIFENLCLACPSCNRYKGTRRAAQDPLTGEEVALFHPHQQIWREHFSWAKDGTDLIGLTRVGRATIAALKINRPQMIQVRRLWVMLGEHPPLE